jgi:hypothetical protein
MIDPDTLVLKRGGFKGEKAESNLLLASGWGIEEKKVLCSMLPEDKKWEPLYDYYDALVKMEVNKPFFPPYGVAPRDIKGYDGIFSPMVEYCSVFPSGVVGLSEKGADLFKAAVNCVKLFTPDWVGYDVVPIVMARLGMGKELATLLKTWPDRVQFFCNGFGHYGRDIMKAETALRFRTVPVRDAKSPDSDQRFDFPTFPFRHMGLDSMPVLACAMNEL